MVYYHLDLFMPRVLEVGAARNMAGGYAFGNDFFPIWLTAREWRRQRLDPYGPEMTRKIQSGLFGRPLDPQNPSDPVSDYRTFAYPAFTDLLFWPAAEAPFANVRIWLAFLLVGMTLASVLLWMRALSWDIGRMWVAVILLLILCSYPVLEGLYAGQLGLLVGFLLAASLLALHRGRYLLAGILMALTMIKPQMTLLAMLYLTAWSLHDWRRRSHFSLGLLVALAVLICAALVVWPHWIPSWLDVVLGYHRYAKPPLVAEVLTAPLGPAASGAVAPFLSVLFAIVALTAAWRHRAASADSSDFWLTLSLVLCVTAITLLPGQAIHDHVILLPAIFLVARGWRALFKDWAGRMLVIIGSGVLLWPWFAAFSLIALRPVLTHHQFYSKAVFALPLRTAAVFPFVVLGLLALLWRTQAASEAGDPSLPC